ncbi:MAG: phosphopentomutase [Clostridia bacterium]|nr:phosphopentomutase [Clostridia bacterium]
MKRRVFLIVIDSCGSGHAPDAAAFGDKGANTLRSASRGKGFSIPTMKKMGLGNVEGLSFLGRSSSPIASYGRMCEASNGKDTTTGHWELAGLVSREPPLTFPDGFPAEIISAFEEKTGRRALVNKPYSGTEIIRDYGEKARRDGSLIVYTSADSVFQIAAHVDAVPLGELYRCCRIARELLVGRYAVDRVIARPFAGTAPDFYRTPDRRDFSLEPPKPTLLDALKAAGKDVIGVGKISDIFAGRGITESDPAHGNPDCLAAASRYLGRDFDGLCFINLVDTDSVYGHRREVDGYAAALTAIDAWLADALPSLGEEDLLIVTADHGCDPAFRGTDHTRETVPLLMYAKKLAPLPLGTRRCFCDVAATAAKWLGVPFRSRGKALYREKGARR